MLYGDIGTLGSSLTTSILICPSWASNSQLTGLENWSPVAPPVPLTSRALSSLVKVNTIGVWVPVSSWIKHPLESVINNSYLPGEGLNITLLLVVLIVPTGRLGFSG